MGDFVGYCSMCGSEHTYLRMSKFSELWVRECRDCGYYEELLSIPDKRIRKGKGGK